MEKLAELGQKWPEIPEDHKLPVFLIGAGGIIKSCHVPSYRALKLNIVGVYDLNISAAEELANEFSITHVYHSINELIKDAQDRFQNKVIYDVATPCTAFLNILDSIPSGSNILLQKPMGKTLKEAKAILALSKKKDFRINMNLQGRFAPGILLLKRAIDQGLFGEIYDITCTENTHTPWELWGWLRKEKEQRMEILYHSIHVIDVFRYLLDADPVSVYCRSIPTPRLPDYNDTRSSIILNFDNDHLMARINTNHTFEGLPEKACSHIQIEGAKASAIVQMGGNLNYPCGCDDELLISLDKKTWQKVPLEGNWFPNAFEGPMANLQRYAAGDDKELITSLDKVFGTMRVIEACYESSKSGGTPLPEDKTENEITDGIKKADEIQSNNDLIVKTAV